MEPISRSQKRNQLVEKTEPQRMTMRPRLDLKDRILVLEGLALLFRHYAGKKDRDKAKEVYLLFESLSSTRIGRRREWVWDFSGGFDTVIAKRRIRYREMQKTISALKSSVSE